MRSPPLLRGSLLAAAALLVHCAPSAAPTPKPPSAAAVAAAPGAAAPPAAESDSVPPRPAHRSRSWSPPAPELGIAQPLPGEPSATTLQTEARLAPSTCEASAEESVALRIKGMRAAVDAEFKRWHDGQPACWAQMREEYNEQKRLEAEIAAGGMVLLRGYGFGSGGAGLGVLGSEHASSSGSGVGTLGHGAGIAADRAGKAARASGTNNQVAGVDEADLVKTDGRYVYLVANGALRIVEALHPRVVSVTKISGSPRALFVEGDRAVVYAASSAPRGPACTYAYDCQFAGDGTSTTVNVFDLRSRAEPRLVRSFALSGSLLAARRIGTAIHTVVADDDGGGPPYATWPGDLPMCGTPETAVRAKFAALKRHNEQVLRSKALTFPTLTENGRSQSLCSALLQPPIHDGEAFTSVVSFDLAADAAPPTFATIESRPGAVFASENALYLAVVHRRGGDGSRRPNGRWYSSYGPSVDEVSEIHKFRLGATAQATRYVGSGTVPGHVLNQFSMDEWYGYLRIATTKGRVPDPRVESVVSVLSETSKGQLARIGAVEKLAPGEDIRAVRFDADRAYVVTFKKTDPLFVLDLVRPAHPTVLGELKIPGFSTYIHRIDRDHLLSIGFDANDHGSFAYFDGLLLQLFDVADPRDPKLLQREKIGTRGSSSEAATDHLAFNYFADEGLLAVPATLCEGGGDGRNGTEVASSGLFVYDVDLERGFTRLGVVDHGAKNVSCQSWWSQGSSAVKRSVFLDDLVYSIAPDRLKVQRLAHLGVDVADLPLGEAP